MVRSWAIGVDLGGTKILAGAVSREGEIGATVEVATPTRSEQDVLEAIVTLVEQLLEQQECSAVGLGVPCNLDRVSNVCHHATNLPLTEVDFTGRLHERVGLPVAVENDGNAAALAEWRLGAGRGATDLVMLTLGTGVGGGLVIDGELYRGWAELGHVVVDQGGPPCQGNCHGRGHLETEASGHAADRAARTLFGEGASAADLLARGRAGDPEARAALDRIGQLLGAAIGSFVNIFDPDLVVIGGGFGVAAGDLILEPARASARQEAVQPADERLRIVEAELGERAGLIGAGLVGFEALDGLR
jgi:glucokinase